MGSPSSLEDHKPILILFDGVCNLCNGIVQFIIKRDAEAIFRFASLQSDVGKEKLKHFNFNPDSLHSIVVIEGNKVFERSDAVLQIGKHLGWPWKSLTMFGIFPKSFRDAFYNLIAKNRYKIFGRQDNCMIPTPELKRRFIE